jgi:sugar lactone lactonase YvrE
VRTGPDGRIYVAQVSGSTISALNVATGEVETISAKGSDIIAPDDVAFHPDGSLYVTEYYDGRVSVRETNGSTRLLRDDLPGANGITIYQGRLFVNECRIGGRLMEVPLDGGAPKVLVDNLPLPNAMEVGPDGLLYYPVMGTNDIWRVNPEGGEPERVVGDLGSPDSVKFDREGWIVSTQAHSGQVLRINPQTGERQVLASLTPGLDNCTFIGDRLFVSSFTGEITEILGGGQTKATLPSGLNWPLDLSVGPDGVLYVADGTHLYALRSGGTLETLGMLFTANYPGPVRGIVAVGPDEFLVTTASGTVSRYRPGREENEPIADGIDQPYGIAVGPGGAVVVAEFGAAGRVLSLRGGQTETLAAGLNQPVGVAFGPDDAVLVAESGAGRVVSIVGSTVDTLVDGLEQPQGLLVRDGQLLIVDAGLKALISVDLGTKTRQTLADNLPVGAPPGVTPKPLVGVQPFTGPQGPFAGIAAGPDGTLYVSADAEGSVLALRREA